MAFKNLDIKDKAEAIIWKRELEQINSEMDVLLKNIGKALQDIKNDADSSIVDEIYVYGEAVVSSSYKITEALNLLADNIETIIKIADEVVDNSIAQVKELIESIRY